MSRPGICISCGLHLTRRRCKARLVLPGPTLDEGLSHLLAVEARAESRDHGWRAS